MILILKSIFKILLLLYIMKLIRLATTNKGIFRSSLDTDLFIQPNAKIALLNVTFQTEFENIEVNSSNNAITFKSDINNADTQQSSQIVEDVYTESDIQLYYDAVETALNNALGLSNASGLTDDKGYNSVTSCFKLHEVDGLLRIDYRYCPFLNPFVTKALGPLRSFFNASDTPASLLQITTTGNDQTTIRAPAATHVANATRNTFGTQDRKLNDGCALFTARCRNVSDNGSGLEDNGFSIGLSTVPIPQISLGTDLSTIYRKFEIRVNRLGENYKYITRGQAEVDSGIAPSLLTLISNFL
jgi:hypothetical protein